MKQTTLKQAYVESDSYQMNLIRTLNTLNNEVTEQELKDYYDRYIDEHQLNKKLKAKDVSDVYLVAKLCWVIYHDYPLQEVHVHQLYERFKTLEQSIVSEKKEPKDTSSPPKKRQSTNTVPSIDYAILTILDTALDKKTYSNVKIEAIIHPLVNVMTLEDIVLVFKNYEIELKQSLNDDQLKEGYSLFSKKEFTERLNFIQHVIVTIEQTIRTKIKYDTASTSLISILPTKKGRKSKAKPEIKKINEKKVIKPSVIQKQLEKFKYAKELKVNESLSLPSMTPYKLLSAKACLIYNKKYNILTLLCATAEQTFTIEGTTIKNIDQSSSISKRVRKPIEAIQNIFNSDACQSTKKLRSLFSLIKTQELPISGRTSEHCYILKTF